MAKLRTMLAVLLCGACGVCGAQALNETLLIGSGDLITVQVLEAPELKQDVRVTDSGTIPLIVGGSVKVAGLTPSGASTAVHNTLVAGQYLLDPHVTVTINESATKKVTLLGQVRNPGAYPTNTPRAVLDVLAMGGGLTDLADRRVTIERQDTKEKIDYFLSNSSSEAIDNQVMVNPGDKVIVPKINVVYVLGDVARPGGYPMATNDGKLSLLQAVGLAGSRLPHGKADSTRLIRKQSNGSYLEMKVALGKMENGKQPDIALLPDDVVYIPFSYLKNMGTNLSAVLAAAGSAAIIHF